MISAIAAIGHWTRLGFVLLFALAVAACGGGEPENLQIPVAVTEEKMSPETIQAKQGDTVTLNIESVESGEFHLHGYDVEQDIGEGEPADFVFLADVSGRFRITFHPKGDEGEEPSGQGRAESGEAHHEEEERDIGFLEVLPR